MKSIVLQFWNQDLPNGGGWEDFTERPDHKSVEHWKSAAEKLGETFRIIEREETTIAES